MLLSPQYVVYLTAQPAWNLPQVCGMCLYAFESWTTKSYNTVRAHVQKYIGFETLEAKQKTVDGYIVLARLDQLLWKIYIGIPVLSLDYW